MVFVYGSQGQSIFLRELLCFSLLLSWVETADLVGQTTLYNVTPPGAGAPYGAGHVVQYVFITDKVSFNEARAICTTFGGDMAKVDTIEKKAWIASLDNDNDTATDPIFSTDHVWSGLTGVTEGSYLWVSDCSNDTSGLYNPSNWNDGHLCFIMEAGKWEYDRKDCDEDRMVLCELPVAINYSSINISPPFNDTSYPDIECTPSATSSSSTTTTTSTSTTTSTTSTTSTPSTSTPTPAPTTSTTAPTTPTLPSTSTSTTATPPSTASTSSTATPTPSSTASTSPTVSFTMTSTTTQLSSTSSTTPVASTSASTTTPATSTPPSSVRCVNVTIISVQEAESIARELAKNLTEDPKGMSSHRRSLTCAEDSRSSAITIGTLGVILLVVLFSLILFSDLIRIYQHFTERRRKKLYGKKSDQRE